MTKIERAFSHGLIDSRGIEWTPYGDRLVLQFGPYDDVDLSYEVTRHGERLCVLVYTYDLRPGLALYDMASPYVDTLEEVVAAVHHDLDVRDRRAREEGSRRGDVESCQVK